MSQFLDCGTVTSPKGFLAAGIKAKIKKSDAKDMALIVSDVPAVCAGVFTTCKFPAAPVILSKQILKENFNSIRAVLINSGNANACTGEKGIRNAYIQLEETAKLLGCEKNQVLVCSTGRIGVQLPMQKVIKGIRLLSKALSCEGGYEAAEAIMTTDTRPKYAGIRFDVGNKAVTIGAIAKGAGMIAPKMKSYHATMIACITTDAKISPSLLNELLDKAVDKSFNRITVDGDMSTNDTVLCLANGMSEVSIEKGSQGYVKFRRALNTIALYMAKELVRDGEGATKLVKVTVRKAANIRGARSCAFSIANSLLCKTAWFGTDPNWGRILAAAGSSKAKIKPEKVNLFYNTVPIVLNGEDAHTSENVARDVLQQDEFEIILELNTGNSSYSVFTSDISYEYVKINAEYRT